MDAKAAEIELIQKASSLLDGKLADEVVNQGHHLTGALERSIGGTVISSLRNTSVQGFMYGYGFILNNGVAPDRIPFGGAPTGAKTSKYIQGLKSFWMLRGLSDKEALSAAFATAKKQKVEGMPSAGSYRFSETGQRTQFIEVVDNKATPELNELILTGIDAIVNELFHETKSETI